MDDGDGVTDIRPKPGTRRSTWARIGCVALNLLEPGLGLLRVGAGRIGSLLLVAPFIWIVGSIAVFAIAPTASFLAIAAYAVIAVSLAIALYVGAMVLTWRRSALRPTATPTWSRWYSLVAIVIIWTAVSRPLVALAHSYYKPFYLPSESMAPTLGKLDRIMADMHGGRHPNVGDIVLVKAGPIVVVKRVVALGGDRVAVKSDVPIVDGVTSIVRPEGLARFLGLHGWERAQLLEERFPRETSPHKILITAPTSYGDMDDRTVPPGHIFVLGDNRERSADSRLPIAETGTDMVPLADLVGRPLYVRWPHESGAIGRPADH